MVLLSNFNPEPLFLGADYIHHQIVRGVARNNEGQGWFTEEMYSEICYLVVVVF